MKTPNLIFPQTYELQIFDLDCRCKGRSCRESESVKRARILLLVRELLKFSNVEYISIGGTCGLHIIVSNSTRIPWLKWFKRWPHWYVDYQTRTTPLRGRKILYGRRIWKKLIFNSTCVKL